MLQDVISSHDQLSIDDITSPLSAQIFDFCDPQLFQETFNQTSEVTSTSNILEKSGSFHSNTNTTTTTENSNNNNNKNTELQDEEDDNNNTDLSIIFDSQEDFENDITASIDFSSSSLQYPVIDQLLTATSQDQFDFSSGLQVTHQPPNISFSGDPLSLPAVSSLAPSPLQSGVFEEDCLSSVPSYNHGLNPSYSFFRTSGLPAYMSTGLLCAESNLGLLPGNNHVGSETNKPHDPFMDFQADNGGLFCPDSIKRIFNPEDLQALGVGGVESQSHLMAPQTNSALGPVEINGLEDSTLSKVGKLSPEQKKEKIRRYMKKRNERNFNKKIKYACRKTLADSRPRVRGRFAKNDEFGEPSRQASSSHHDDEDEDDMGVKDEEQFVDSSDIFAHISGANSFKFNYPIQSWI
ncbi:PREDICTED: two-component response regulator-like APRR7 isoform X2 [Camelina sativa]|uniref:Two-component response regulator-like APRR7 isoform X2 n=1 Tax=Camelina sativa TaxID=90675 RepID=A0ABM0WDD6_CAMSA|nr:PREDICTED: two-component response regulator-like APRR7 isoform X2 [Camelina sativa]